MSNDRLMVTKELLSGGYVTTPPGTNCVWPSSHTHTYDPFAPTIFPGGTMAYPQDSAIGSELIGGLIKIKFPHMNLELSCDSESELEQAIDMLRKAFEVYQYNEAKRIMTSGDDSV